MSLTPLPPLPPPPHLLEKYIFFALPSMNGPLPAELKFRENTVFDAIKCCVHICGDGKGLQIQPRSVKHNATFRA